jgi:8-oxo-dGTP pyrophosphatase MutT (NUDIX family)
MAAHNALVRSDMQNNPDPSVMEKDWTKENANYRIDSFNLGSKKMSAAIIIWKEGAWGGIELLLVKDKVLGKWGFPGGRIERTGNFDGNFTYETPKDTAIREAYEEVGIKINPKDVEDKTVQLYKYITFFYKVETSFDISLDKEEILDAQWVNLNTVYSYRKLSYNYKINGLSAPLKEFLAKKPEKTFFT